MWYPTMVNFFFNSLSDDASSKSFCQRVVGNITVAAEGANNTCTDTHLSPNTIYSGLAIGVAFACLNLVASSVATWRRLVLTASLVVAAVSLVLVDLMTNPIASMILFTLIQITAIGIGSVASYFVDLYPTAYRALVTSLGLTMGRLVSWGGVNLLGNAIVDYCSITFYGWAVFACSGIIASLLLPPDKRPGLSN
ncbi:uncharacterized protein LOC113238012 [Hyposmocoma kahamanoa]|uniref:uncharacterized protein LOC113238012 n=1 Tax=Hyposmocoma kahamanoa TaxID=1477025 RepID=UPI000E6D5ACC|nr:uncharacterized protein LOC113238012 [Hyposmocoma kahamanoa]